MTHTLHELLNKAELAFPSDLVNPIVHNIVCDSRKIKQGDLFIGISGSNVDGGFFWQEAISAGAVAAIIGKESEINLAKEGIFSHISYFHKAKCHNLFNFTIESKKDYHHQKISYSEWCKGMNIKFSFLNKDIKKSVRKILRNI